MRIIIYLLCLAILPLEAEADWQESFNLAISNWEKQVEKGIHIMAWGVLECEIFSSDTIFEYRVEKKFRVYSWKRRDSEKYYTQLLYSPEEKMEEGNLQISIDVFELASINAAFRDFDYTPIRFIRTDTLDNVIAYVIKAKDLPINRTAWIWVSPEGNILKVRERNKTIYFKEYKGFTVPSKSYSGWISEELAEERQVKLSIDFEKYKVWPQVHP